MDRGGANPSTVVASWTMAIWQGLARMVRNPDRGREALSPRGILYAWTWPEMARETHPGAWFEPAMSARFGASPSPSGVPCLRPMPRNDCAGIRHARQRRAAFCHGQDTTANFRCGRP